MTDIIKDTNLLNFLSDVSDLKVSLDNTPVAALQRLAVSVGERRSMHLQHGMEVFLGGLYSESVFTKNANGDLVFVGNDHSLIVDCGITDRFVISTLMEGISKSLPPLDKFYSNLELGNIENLFSYALSLFLTKSLVSRFKGRFNLTSLKFSYYQLYSLECCVEKLEEYAKNIEADYDFLLRDDFQIFGKSGCELSRIVNNFSMTLNYIIAFSIVTNAGYRWLIEDAQKDMIKEFGHVFTSTYFNLLQSVVNHVNLAVKEHVSRVFDILLDNISKFVFEYNGGAFKNKDELIHTLEKYFSHYNNTLPSSFKDRFELSLIYGGRRGIFSWYSL